MKEGDFLKIEYVGKIADTDEIFDLTDGELAKKNGIHNEGQKYGPVLVIVGSGMVIPGVDDKLREMKKGEEKEFDVTPDNAFGKRDVKKIKIVSTTSFIRQKINPVPGAYVDINGRKAKIQSVSGGRVRVDFNHPLAGKTLRYKVKIAEDIREPVDKVKSIMDYYRLPADVEMVEGKLSIKTKENTPEPVRKLMTDIITKWIKEVKKVEFSDPDTKPAQEKQETPQEKKTQEKKPEENKTEEKK